MPQTRSYHGSVPRTCTDSRRRSDADGAVRVWSDAISQSLERCDGAMRLVRVWSDPVDRSAHRIRTVLHRIRTARHRIRRPSIRASVLSDSVDGASFSCVIAARRNRHSGCEHHSRNRIAPTRRGSRWAEGTRALVNTLHLYEGVTTRTAS